MTFAWVGLCFGVPMLVAAAGVAVGAFVESAREKRRHARVLEGLGSPVRSDDLIALAPRSIATLEGTLAGSPGGDGTQPSAPTVSFHPYGTSFLDEPNVYAVTHVPDGTTLVLLLDGGARAALEGPSQVLAGAVESEHAAPLEQASSFEAGSLATGRVRARVGQFRSVGAGDRVRVRGAIEPAPDDDALYRERSMAFRVSPEPTTVPGAPLAITVAAVAPAVRRRVTPRRHVWIAAAAAITVGGAASLTLPGRLDRTPMENSASKTSVAVVAGPPECRGRVVGHLEANRPLEAAAEAKTCEDAYARALVHFTNGDFKEASAGFSAAIDKDWALVPSVTEAEAHLFAHDDVRAAAVAHRMVTHFYPGPSTAEKRYLECIAGLFDDRATHAPRRKGRSGDASYRKICADRAFSKFARELDAEGGYWGEEDWLEFSSGLSSGATYTLPAAYDAVAHPLTAAVGPRARLFARPVGVERALLDRLVLARSPSEARYGRLDIFRWHEEDYYALMTPFAAELSLFYANAGFPERSAPYWPILDRVASVMEGGPPTSFHTITTEFDWDKKAVKDERELLTYVMSVAAAAALLSGDNARADRYARHGETASAYVVKQLRRMLAGEPWETPAEDGGWPDHKALFDAGLNRGDGATLAAALTAQRSTGRDVLARILPRLTRNREALDTWLKTSFPAPCLTCGASNYLGHLADRREVARLLGAKDESERIRPAAARFTDALTDPSFAFELDEIETFFGRKN